MQGELDARFESSSARLTCIGWRRCARANHPTIACVRAKTRHQLTNALLCLFTLRAHGSEEIFAVLRDHTTHGEIRVRSKAVGLLIGMMKLHRLRPPFDHCGHDSAASFAVGADM
jgi:hypothetical protein